MATEAHTDTVPMTADLLYGARAIAGFLGVTEKAAYHLIDRKRIPVFRIGRTVCARRSKLLGAMDALEEQQQALAG